MRVRNETDIEKKIGARERSSSGGADTTSATTSIEGLACKPPARYGPPSISAVASYLSATK